MNLSETLSIIAIIIAAAGAIYAGMKSSSEIKNMKVDRERTLGQIIESQDKAIAELRAENVELNRKFTDLSAYVGELLAGIDMLIEQITVKHKDTPVWHPNRRKEDK